MNHLIDELHVTFSNDPTGYSVPTEGIQLRFVGGAHQGVVIVADTMGPILEKVEDLHVSDADNISSPGYWHEIRMALGHIRNLHLEDDGAVKLVPDGLNYEWFKDKYYPVFANLEVLSLTDVSFRPPGRILRKPPRSSFLGVFGIWDAAPRHH
ncbi:hypothetical protein OE88DRAFT_1662526, partial [Heliocybe sulcata]